MVHYEWATETDEKRNTRESPPTRSARPAPRVAPPGGPARGDRAAGNGIRNNPEISVEWWNRTSAERVQPIDRPHRPGPEPGGAATPYRAAG